MAERENVDDSLATAIDRRRRLCSWGANGHGQLGIASREDQLLPVEVKVEWGDKDTAIKAMGGGGGFSFVLLTSGALQTCGNNDRGQLGQGGSSGQGKQPFEDTFKPCDVTLMRPSVMQVAAGWDFMVALCGDGTVFSWGSNSFGQLGRDLEQGGKNHSSSPGMVDFQHKVRQTQITAGLRHVLSLAEDGTIFAWGHGRRGQLGSHTSDGKVLPKSDRPLQVPISNADPVASLFAGMHHSGALTATGSLYLWGCNKYGQCCVKAEDSVIVPIPTKTQIPLQEDRERLVEVSSGWTHLVARSNCGRLYSWGRKDLGQLGRSCDLKKTHVPGLVEGLVSVKNNVCGSEHNLAVTDDGCVYSWGWNEHGICATGDEENVPYPNKISAFNHDFILDVGCAAGHSFCTIFQKME